MEQRECHPIVVEGEREGDLPLTFLKAVRLDGVHVEEVVHQKAGAEIDTWLPWNVPDTI